MISQRLGSTDSASPQGRRPDTIYGQIAGAHYGAVAIVRGCVSCAVGAPSARTASTTSDTTSGSATGRVDVAHQARIAAQYNSQLVNMYDIVMLMCMTKGSE